MKLNSICFTVLALFICNILSAQQPQFFLPSPPINQLTESQTSPDSQMLQFELIDLTGDSSVLGYLKISDSSNERQAIVTPVKKEDWLRATISGKASKAFANPTKSLLYILNDISVGRISAGNYVRISAAVYQGDEKGFFLLKNVDTLVTDKAKNISSIGDLINTAIGSTAAQLKSAIAQNPIGKQLSRDDVIRLENEKYAFISKSRNLTGIYMTYNDFKKGKPTFERFHLKKDEQSATLTVQSFTDADSTFRDVTPWGIAVQNELYFFSGNKLYPVEAVGNNLVFSKFMDPDSRKNNASFWRMTIGDKLSGKENNILDNVNTLVLDNYHGKGLTGEAIKINAETGEAEF